MLKYKNLMSNLEKPKLSRSVNNLKVKSYITQEPDPYRAGIEIASELEELNPEVIFVFSSIHYVKDNSELLDGIYDSIENKNLIVIGNSGDGIYESGATLTSSNIISILTLTSQFAENPQANSHAWIYLQDNGTYAPDVLIRAGSTGDIGDSAMTGDHTFDTADRAIAVYFQSGGTYYIPLMNNKGD